MSSATRRQLLSSPVFIVYISSILSVSCHICNLDNDSYNYCKRVTPSGGALSEAIFSIYQCRDICDRKRCAAFEYHVVKYNANNDNRECWLYFVNTQSPLQLRDAANCDSNEWWYSWIRPGPVAVGKDTEESGISTVTIRK